MGMKPYPLYDVRTITTIKDMTDQSIKLYAKKNAFLVKKEKGAPYTGITYEEFGNDLNGLGTAFHSLGLTGKRIAIISENRYEWALSYLASLNGNSTVVPLDKELPPEDIRNLLQTAQASGIIYSKKYSKAMQEIKAEFSFIDHLINMDLTEDTDTELSFQQLLSSGKKLVSEGSNTFQNTVINPDSANILLFTSGTTGNPKGVLLSHKNITTDLMAMCQMVYIDDKDVFLSVLPLHHTYECTCGFLCPLYRGCTIAYCEGLKYVLPNLKEAKATMMLAVPALFETMYGRIMKTVRKNGLEKKVNMGLKLSNFLRKIHIDKRRKIFAQIHETLGGNIRLFISGAAAIDPEVSKGFRDFGISFIQGYGITECSPIVALNRDYQYKDDAAGLALPCLEVKISEPDDNGIGEIICRGNSVMLGYYENEDATKEVFTDGWFHTGDLGYQDKEGFFHITGRQKNVIVLKNGKNIFPEELETLLNRNPYVSESMISGIYNEETGETELLAQILPDMETIHEVLADADEEKIKELMEEAVKEVNQRNPLYKHIHQCEVRHTAFIKTTTQKIKRYMESPQK